MTVKTIIKSALNLLGRAEVAEALTASSELEGEAGELVNTLLYCFNAVEDELARKYIPLITREDMNSPTCKYYFVSFEHTPVKIKKVIADGNEIAYEVYAQYLYADAKHIAVEYEYAPVRKGLSDRSDYDGDVGEYLFALGIASEYCLINGEVEMCERWESKYRKRIDEVQPTLPACANIPPRRWI